MWDVRYMWRCGRVQEDLDSAGGSRGRLRAALYEREPGLSPAVTPSRRPDG
jgi:hypothetical protein